MVISKSCPRCRGDMYADRDIYGEYRQCLQCGYMEDVPKPAYEALEKLIAADKEVA